MSRLSIGGQIRRGLLMMVVVAAIIPMIRCGGGDNGGGSSSAPPPGPGGGGGTAQFAYVISTVDSQIRAYNLDGAGNLTSVGTPIATGLVPHHVNVDPQGSFVYVSNHDSTFVSGFRINQDGTLTGINQQPGSPVTPAIGGDPTENQPHSSVMDQTRQFLYVVFGHNAPSTLRAYSIDASTGVLTFISGQSFPVGIHAHNITISPNNLFLYVASEGSDEVHAFSRNTTTGALTSVGAVAGMDGASAVTVDPQNRFLYASYTNAVEVFAIGNNGALTRIVPTSMFSTNNSGTGSGPHAIAMHPNGQSLYTANINGNTVTVFGVDSNTGVLTEIQSPSPATGTDPNFVIVHPNGQFLYTADNVSDRVSQFTINANGTLVIPVIIAIPAVDGASGIGTTKF